MSAESEIIQMFQKFSRMKLVVMKTKHKKQFAKSLK